MYTTSYRSTWYILKLFWLHGIHLNGIVNQSRHNREATANCTKHPPGFGIDWLLDDSEGVRLEGEWLQLRVLVIQPHDKEWVARAPATFDTLT